MRPTDIEQANRAFIALLILLFAATATATGVLAHRLKPPSPPDTFLLAQPRALSPFELQRADSAQTFTNGDLSGKWSLVYTGYLNCPDLCPTTLSQLSKVRSSVLSSIPNGHNHLNIVFASIDHFRDHPEALAAYTKHFDPGFIPITGEAKPLAVFTRNLGFLPPPDMQQNAIGHSSAIAIIGPDARLHGLFRHPHDYPMIERTLRQRLSQPTKETP